MIKQLTLAALLAVGPTGALMADESSIAKDANSVLSKIFPPYDRTADCDVSDADDKQPLDCAHGDSIRNRTNPEETGSNNDND